MVDRLSPRARARDANEWRRSWRRTPSRPAFARMRSSNGRSGSRGGPPGLRPGNDPGVSGDARAAEASTDTAAADTGTTRGPGLAVA